jgi:hypothetical protein
LIHNREFPTSPHHCLGYGKQKLKQVPPQFPTNERDGKISMYREKEGR